MLKVLDPLERYKKRILRFANSKKCPDELREFYKRSLPDGLMSVKKARLCSIDFETTGINPNEDFVLSVGGIFLEDNCISFETAFHYYVNNAQHIKKESAIINQITPEQLAEGKEPKAAMLELLDKISGGLVLMHCKFIEMNFIRHSLGLKPKDPLPFIPIDTMLIERYLLKGGHVNDVRLAQIRKRRGFPTYTAHNALADSISTLEVFLAQLKDVFGKKNPSIKKCYTISN